MTRIEIVKFKSVFSEIDAGEVDDFYQLFHEFIAFQKTKSTRSPPLKRGPGRPRGSKSHRGRVGPGRPRGRGRGKGKEKMIEEDEESIQESGSEIVNSE